jgi:hypothetical protein
MGGQRRGGGQEVHGASKALPSPQAGWPRDASRPLWRACQQQRRHPPTDAPRDAHPHPTLAGEYMSSSTMGYTRKGGRKEREER